MKKILIIVLLILTLSSCGNENDKNLEGKTTKTEKVEIKNKYLLDVKEEKIDDKIVLSGNISGEIEKIEIIGKNGNKKDKYFLKKFKKGDKKWLTNLKTEYGNIWLGDNKYIIKGYIGNKVVEEIKYSIHYNCIIKVSTAKTVGIDFENLNKKIILDFGDDKKCNNGKLDLKFKLSENRMYVEGNYINLDNSKFYIWSKQGWGSYSAPLESNLLNGKDKIKSGEELKYSVDIYFKDYDNPNITKEEENKLKIEKNIDEIKMSLNVGVFEITNTFKTKSLEKSKKEFEQKIKLFKEIKIINL